MVLFSRQTRPRPKQNQTHLNIATCSSHLARLSFLALRLPSRRISLSPLLGAESSAFPLAPTTPTGSHTCTCTRNCCCCCCCFDHINQSINQPTPRHITPRAHRGLQHSHSHSPPPAAEISKHAAITSSPGRIRSPRCLLRPRRQVWQRQFLLRG